MAEPSGGLQDGRRSNESTVSPVGVLASFFYFSGFDFDRVPENVPIILDSGAFSAYTLGKHIDIDDYAAWVKPLADRIEFALNLDVLGDESRSLRNWRRLTQRGIHSAPVIHYGTRPEDALPPYLAEGADVITLGGIAVSGAGRQVQAWCATVLRWLAQNAPHVRTHGLGVHSSSPTARLPFDTIDSSSPTSAYRFARALVFDPLAHQWRKINLNERDAHKHGRMLRALGVEPSRILSPNAENRPDLIRMIAHSEVAGVNYYNKSARTRRAFVANSSGRDQELMTEALGRRTFVVDAAETHFTHYAQILSNGATW